MSKRDKIPDKTATLVLFENRHICCVCNQPKHVVIHHIDGNKNNNEINNLAVVCSECHSRITGNEGLGRKFTESEVRMYKETWESKCKTLFEAIGKNKYENWNEDDYVELIEDHKETTIINAAEHYLLEYELDENNEIKIKLRSKLPINVMIQNRKDYNLWIKRGEIESFEIFERVTQLKYLFITPIKDNYNVVFVNENDEDVEVDIDIKIWG